MESVHIPGIKLVKTVWIITTEQIENSTSGACVLHTSSNLIISRRSQDEDVKEVHKNVKCTCGACKTIVFAY